MLISWIGSVSFGLLRTHELGSVILKLAGSVLFLDLGLDRKIGSVRSDCMALLEHPINARVYHSAVHFPSTSRPALVLGKCSACGNMALLAWTVDPQKDGLTGKNGHLISGDLGGWRYSHTSHIVFTKE